MRTYLYEGAVERKVNGSWVFDGNIARCDWEINETAAYSEKCAARNILHKYVMRVKGLNPNMACFYRLCGKPIAKTAESVKSNCESPRGLKSCELSNAKFEQLKLF